MKILMLLENEFLRDPRVEKEVQSLFKAGHEVIVAAVTSSGLPYEERKSDCIVLRKNISKFIVKSSVGALKVPVYFNFWRRHLRKILKNYKPEAIHVHDLPLCQVALELKKKYNCKVVLDLHENWPALLGVSAHTNTFLGRILSSEKEWRSYEKSCAGKADAIIAVVDEMKTRIAKLGIPQEKIYVLENTPDSDKSGELIFERDENYFTLLYVGGISYHRGLQYVIDGISLLVNEIPVRLWIAGDGKFAASLKDRVKKLGLENHVKFYGLVAQSDVKDLMRKADYGLIPHVRSEQSDNSSPNKLFEYMETGLPVLASDCISVKRLLGETNAGTTYIHDSPSDFANVVRQLCTDKKNSVIFSANGRRAIKERYNWLKSSSSLLKLYADLK